MRFIGDPMLARYLRGMCPIVRWTDRWGKHWEHRQGKSRRSKLVTTGSHR
jgi:hypothetical protein